MELKQLFNEAGFLYKIVTRKKGGDEFTDGWFKDIDQAFKCQDNAYNRLSDYDKSKSEVAIQRYELENVVDCDCNLEEETNIEYARECLVFSGYDEIVKGELK